MLESLGASVILAEDGAEALDIVGRQPFDVMLVDIEMPRVSGIEVMRTVRGLCGAIAQVPMIALTAYVMREHRAAIDAAGADGVIAKPILSIEQFGSDIRRYMARRGHESSGSGDPQSAPTTGEAAVIDQGIYDALADAIGSAAMGELLEKVGPDIQGARDRLERATGPVDPAEIRALTHILISVAGAIGAKPVQELAKQMNTAGHGNDAAAVETDAPRLLSEIDRLLAFVSEKRGETAR